jgi:hypothetical protein
VALFPRLQMLVGPGRRGECQKRRAAMNDPDITWRRTFPDSAPGTDGVAIFEGRIIGRVRHITNLPQDPKPCHRPGSRRPARLGQPRTAG